MQWIRRAWGRNRDDTRRLLILDSAAIHKMRMVREHLETEDTDLVIIPGGCTSLLQPADVSWNHPFKVNMRRQYATWRREERRTPQGNLQTATRQNVINWVSQAWDEVEEGVLVNSFKACGLTTALDGSEDHLIHDKLGDAMQAAEREQEDAMQDDVFELLFGDSDDDESFYGFSDQDSDSNEDE